MGFLNLSTICSRYKDTEYNVNFGYKVTFSKSRLAIYVIHLIVYGIISHIKSNFSCPKGVIITGAHCTTLIQAKRNKGQIEREKKISAAIYQNRDLYA